MIGQQYNHWTVLYLGEKKHSVVAKCDCGTIKEVIVYNLLNGHSLRCMHCAHAKKRPNSISHKSGYRLWRRCRHQLCPEWADNFESFASFIFPKYNYGRLLPVDGNKPIGPGNWIIETSHDTEQKLINKLTSVGVEVNIRKFHSFSREWKSILEHYADIILELRERMKIEESKLENLDVSKSST